MMRWITVALAVVLIVGCVAKPQPVPVEKNPRIIERNLTRQRDRIERPVATVPRIERPTVQPVAVEQVKEPLKFEIEFANDSSSKLLSGGKVALQEIQAQVGAADSVVLIGYSNGITSVGNSLLASSRADFVAAKLEAFGLTRDKIKTLASWSPKANKEAPAKGVQVFMMVSPAPSEIKSRRAAT